MSHSYSHIWNTYNCLGFTVYGPYVRPDMALFKFVDSAATESDYIYNHGNMKEILHIYLI